MNHIFPHSENDLDDSNLNILTSKIEAVFRKITKYFVTKSKKFKFASEFPMNDICLSVNEYSTSKKARTSKPLDVASKRQQYRRLQSLVDMIKDVAVEEKTSEHYLIGLILHQIYYHSDRKKFWSKLHLAKKVLIIWEERATKEKLEHSKYQDLMCCLVGKWFADLKSPLLQIFNSYQMD